MIPSSCDNDDLQFDRLVDGELSPEQRRQFLASLEGRPDAWRRCALAFIEAQTWGGEMRRLVGDFARPGTPASMLHRPAPGWQSAPARLGKTSRAGSWLAMAASLAVAFGLGAQTNRPLPADVEQSMALSPPALPDVRVEQPAASGDAVTLVVDDSRGARHRLQVPLIEGRALGQQFTESPQWSGTPALRQRLDKLGLGMQARRRYAPLYFEQENHVVPMVVPVDDAHITPVQRQVF